MRVTPEMIEEIDMEFFLERESVSFKVTSGVSGDQLHIQTCPECGDDRWRTYFGIDTGRGNCFVCSKGFSKVGFIHAQLGHGDGNWSQTFMDIAELLEEQGWRPPRPKPVVAVQAGDVKLPVSTPIPDENGVHLQYLADRGFTADVAKYFELRNCAFGWWQFKKADGDDGVQDFQERVIIPVFDLDGTLKTFQGRDKTGKSDRKYLFPSGLPGTGRYLLNGHNCIGSQRACMGEGIFDVAAIKMAMDDAPDLADVTALGSFGKHLSYGDKTGDDQLGRFFWLRKQGLREVTIMWDGELNALKAALEAAERITAVGLSVRVALLPPGKDPNEVDAEVVRQAFRNALPYTKSLFMQLRLRNPYRV